MKRALIILIATAVAASLCACSSESEPDERYGLTVAQQIASERDYETAVEDVPKESGKSHGDKHDTSDVSEAYESELETLPMHDGAVVIIDMLESGNGSESESVCVSSGAMPAIVTEMLDDEMPIESETYDNASDGALTTAHVTHESETLAQLENEKTFQSELATEEPTVLQTMTEQTVAAQSENVRSYVLNTNSKKFHYPDCSSAEKIKNENRSEYKGTREDIIAKGYSPCKRCEP